LVFRFKDGNKEWRFATVEEVTALKYVVQGYQDAIGKTDTNAFSLKLIETTLSSPLSRTQGKQPKKKSNVFFFFARPSTNSFVQQNRSPLHPIRNMMSSFTS